MKNEPPPRWTEYLPVNDLTPATRNPNRHQTAKLAASIERHGFVEPIIVDERTGRMVGGHGRRERIIETHGAGAAPPEGVMVGPAGEWLVPVQRGWASKNDAEAEAYLLVSNLPPDNDDDVLFEMLTDLDESNDLLGSGFDVDDLVALADVVSVDEPTPGGTGTNHGRGLGEPVIQYRIVFDNEGQQTRWHSFVRWLRETHEGETAAERLDAYLAEVLPE